MKLVFSKLLTKINDKDKKTYEAGILKFINTHFKYNDYRRYFQMNEWTINISDTTESEEAKFRSVSSVGSTLNFLIPHGITNDVSKTVDCYINNGAGIMFIRQNMVTILHELCHMILFIYYNKTKMRLRLQDKRVRSGQEVALANGEVHNRKDEGRFWSFSFGGRNIGLFTIGKITIKVIDIRDLCLV